LIAQLLQDKRRCFVCPPILTLQTSFQQWQHFLLVLYSQSCDPDYDETSWSWPGIGETAFLFHPYSKEGEIWYNRRMYDGNLWTILKSVAWRVANDRILTDMGYRANQWDEALRDTYIRWAIIYLDDDMTLEEIDTARREKRKAEDAMWFCLNADYDQCLAWRGRFIEGPLHQLLASPPKLSAPKPRVVLNPDAW
jgi:hypothetical protein